MAIAFTEYWKQEYAFQPNQVSIQTEADSLDPDANNSWQTIQSVSDVFPAGVFLFPIGFSYWHSLLAFLQDAGLEGTRDQGRTAGD